MKKSLIFLMIVISVLTSCKNTVSILKDKDTILDSSQYIISNQIQNQGIIADSFDVLDVHEEVGDVVIVFATHSENKNRLYESQGLWICPVEKGKEGFKGLGASGSIGDVYGDVNIQGIGNNIYGSIKNPSIDTIRLIYFDGFEVELDINDKGFFYYYRNDVKEASFPSVRGLNNKGEVIYDCPNGTI